MRTWLPLIVVLAGCEAQGEGAAYAGALKPLLTQNLTLSLELVEVARTVKSDPAAAGRELERLPGHYVPAAVAVAEAAAKLAPGASLAEEHAALVGAWQARATAYGALDAAARAGDSAAWGQALGELAAARAGEAAAITAIEAELSREGVVLDPWGVHGP